MVTVVFVVVTGFDMVDVYSKVIECFVNTVPLNDSANLWLFYISI